MRCRSPCAPPGSAQGDAVLTNAFTLAPVPGAVAAVGARPVLVEVTEDLVLDLDDLAVKAAASDARAMLLSHMRGHLCDMDRLVAICDGAGLPLIEDCAHTMGARWRGRRSGSFGLAGCFRTQTYKHMNSGEGGLLVSDDADFMARATILSGSYMLYGRHGAGPERARLRCRPPRHAEHPRRAWTICAPPSCARSSERIEDVIAPLECALCRRGGELCTEPGDPTAASTRGGSLRRQLDPVPPAGHCAGRRAPVSHRDRPRRRVEVVRRA